MEITLTQGKVAIVDDDDFEELNKYKWQFLVGGYATRRDNTKKNRPTIWMHREIMNPPNGMEVDHINSNTLDNRKENLRICTHADNCKNQSIKKNNTSGYKGVSWKKYRWRSRILVNNKLITIGNFKNAIDAAKEYDKAAIKYFGKFAKTNFEANND